MTRKDNVTPTDQQLVRAMAKADVFDAVPPDPKHVFILSGGIAAGKTTLVNRLKTDFHFISGSPADILKMVTADILISLLDGDAQGYVEEMLEQTTKAEYRELLVALGEFVSNRDNYFWANQSVEAAEREYNTLASAGIPSGIVFDSIRRPAEILAVKARWPKAAHIHLDVSHARQMDYLTGILGYSEAKAEDTLAAASEHWLDSMGGTAYDAQYVIDANGGDPETWKQLMGIVILQMDGATLQVAAAIVDDEGR